jgi:transposase
MIRENVLVGFNFRSGDREQPFLLPPDMRDWLPADHLVWFVIDVVEQIDLSAFRRAYRADGHGRAAYDPALMVAVLLYAYCTGLRSSRLIERRCVEDVTFRVLAGGLCPDHVTVARFRSRHADALAGVFVESLRLCAEAGLVRLGVVALDGTKMGANASADANRTVEALDREIAAMIEEAEKIDAAEDDRDDDAGQTPAGMVDPVKRRAELAAAQQRLQEAKTRLEATAAERAQKLEARTATGNVARAARGLPPRTLRPRPSEKLLPDATTNLTDPDSRVMLARHGRIQGYNAQWACTAEQIIVAAQVTQAGNDVEQLEPMLTAARATLGAAGIVQSVQALVADAGYWRAANVDGTIPDTPELYISVAKHGRRGKPRKDGKPAVDKTLHLVEAMKAKLGTAVGKEMLRARRTSIEPLFGQAKANATPATSPDEDSPPPRPSGNSSPPPATSASSSRPASEQAEPDRLRPRIARTST